MKQIIKARKIDGFDSALERKRWIILKSYEDRGYITNLERQVPFPLEINDVIICRYIADFIYLTPAGSLVVEDVKGFTTEVYRLKKKLMKACYGIEIAEIGPRKINEFYRIFPRPVKELSYPKSGSERFPPGV